MPDAQQEPTRTEARRRGAAFAIAAPSGAGKTTIVERLLQTERGIKRAVTVTTRPPRKGEVDGVDYHFITMEAFEALAGSDGLLEHAIVHGNGYGVPRQPLMSTLDAGTDVLLIVDWQGFQRLREALPRDLVGIFILPPSRAELERRLRGRGLDSDEAIARRLANAAGEMRKAPEFDHVIINADLDVASSDVRAIIFDERIRRERNNHLLRFVETLCAV